MRMTSFAEFFNWLGAKIRRNVFQIRVSAVTPEDANVVRVPVWFRCQYERFDRKDFSEQVGTRADGTQGYRTPTFGSAGNESWLGPDLHTLTLKHYNGLQILRVQCDTKEGVEAIMANRIENDYFGKALAESCQTFDRAQLAKAAEERITLAQWIILKHGEPVFRSILEGMGDTRDHLNPPPTFRSQVGEKVAASFATADNPAIIVRSSEATWIGGSTDDADATQDWTCLRCGRDSNLTVFCSGTDQPHDIAPKRRRRPNGGAN